MIQGIQKKVENKNLFLYIIFAIFVAISGMYFLNIGAKSEYKLDLESAIDCYLNCETPEYENLKNRFYRISQNSDNDDVKTTALYYLSEILLLQNNITEAYKFIDQADNINTADTIDIQKNKIKKLMPVTEFLVDSHYTNIIQFQDDNILMLQTNKQYIQNKESLTVNQKSMTKEDDNNLGKIISVGREEVATLYKDKKYDSAINATKTLIAIIKNLKNEAASNKELSQLYQDLAILYAKQNKIDDAKEAIAKAIELDPSDTNNQINYFLEKK